MKVQMTELNRSQLLMDQFGRRLASRLDSSAQLISHDIGERLRVARMQAIAAKKAPAWETLTAGGIQAQGNLASLHFDYKEGNLWNKFASFLPLAALVVGVFVLFNFNDHQITTELAEVDAKLLLDDLPPTAYTDPGFLKFLQLSTASSNDSESPLSSESSDDQPSDSSTK
jgi:hypothetical protein